MDNRDRVLKALDSIAVIITELKRDLTIESNISNEVNKSTPMVEDKIDNHETIKEVLNSDKWPEAVNPHLICDPNSEEDKLERARGIIELMIEEDLKDLKFLDFGCGQGHCAHISKEYDATLSVGYDVEKQKTWESFEANDKTIFTENFDTVKENGPYDIILLFDFIDHLKISNPAQVLSEVKDFLSEKGRVYMRCHPSTSRHATHLYHDFNKAYVHLVFSKEELKELNVSSKFEEENNGPIHPIAGYGKFIKESGLKEVNRRDITESPEAFFKTPEISKRIMKNTGHDSFPEFQMSLQFIDYVLEK